MHFACLLFLAKSQYLEPAHRIDDDDEEGREMLKRGVHRKGNARGWTASLIDVVESFWYGGDADLNYFRGNFTELSLAELEEGTVACSDFAAFLGMLLCRTGVVSVLFRQRSQPLYFCCIVLLLLRAIASVYMFGWFPLKFVFRTG